MAEIPLLLILIVYVIYQFIKPYPTREKNIFLTYTKSGAKIPGMRTHTEVKKEKDKTMKKLLTIIILLLSLSSFAQVEVIKINCQRAYTPCYV